jgi:enterochelin esterase family protein
MKMAVKTALLSQRLATLEAALTAGDRAALAAFWQEVRERGTPLIEPIEGDDAHALITLLWRGEDATENVVVFGGPAGYDTPRDHQMERLLDTDVWHKSYRVRSDLRTTYLLSPNDPLTKLSGGSADYGTRLLPDPLNPRRFVYTADAEIPDDREAVVSVLELPAAVAQPWIVPRPAVAKGQVELHRVRSEMLNNERRVWVYTPPGYTTSGEPCGLLLLFDGLAYIDLIPTPTILDNLISEGKIPPLVAVLPDSLNQETRNRELPCHEPFVSFLTQELLPWVHERYHVSADPKRVIVGGSSYGGLAAAFVGLRASEHFGNVLSQSGSFWWDYDPEDGLPQHWLIQQFVASPRVPVRFYCEVGLRERSGGADLLASNWHMRDVLRLKGYEVHYAEFSGGHDYICWRGSLASGLLKLVGATREEGSSIPHPA